MQVPEKFRVKKGVFASTPEYGNNGAFVIPHHRIADYFYQCLSSDEHGWEHVSVVIYSNKRKVDRTPTWEEMCHIKKLFWGAEEAVMQFHPKESDYVNNHPNCLHLWKQVGKEPIMPPAYIVGIRKQDLPTKKESL